jgi:hypothetical protein
MNIKENFVIAYDIDQIFESGKCVAKIPFRIPVFDTQSLHEELLQIIRLLSDYIADHCPDAIGKKVFDLTLLRNFVDASGDEFEIEFKQMDGDKAVYKILHKNGGK